MEGENAQIQLDVILNVMQNHIFGKTEAAEIVGGEARLKELIAESKIRVEKLDRKWLCNAADVLRYTKVRNKSNRKNKVQ